MKTCYRTDQHLSVSINNLFILFTGSLSITKGGDFDAPHNNLLELWDMGKLETVNENTNRSRVAQAEAVLHFPL